MPQFVLGRNVHENVRQLRVALGSITRPLGVIDLARVLSDRHPERSISMSTVQRWEAGTEPDLLSIRVMADLAGVTFEQFAFGDPNAKAPTWSPPATKVPPTKKGPAGIPGEQVVAAEKRAKRKGA